MNSWKKVYESDIESVVFEIKDIVESPCVIILDGEVGAGKTTFVKEFNKFLDISSPTYSVINEAGEVLHADLYRLEDPDDLTHLEIPMYLEEKDYFLVEWGEKYSHYLQRICPPDFAFFSLKIEINETKDSDTPESRNYFLREIS